MSVWKAACYRDDVLQHVCNVLPKASYGSEFVHSLCDFDIGDPGTFSLPSGIVAGNLRKQVEKAPHILQSFIDYTRKPDPNNEAFARLTDSLGTARFGIHGVYRFLAANWNAIFRETEIEQAQGDYFRTIFNFGYAASYRTAREGDGKAQSSLKSLKVHVAGPHQAIRDLIKLGTWAAGKSYRQAISNARLLNEEFPEIERNVPSWLKRYQVYWYKSLLFLVTPGTRDCYVFTRDDINRIEKLVMGLAWCGYYFAEYTDITHGLNERLTAAYDEIRAEIKGCFSRVTKRNANLVCRAFDTAVWYYLASVSTDVSTRAQEAQRAKIANEGLAEIIDQEKLISIVNRFQLRESLELLQVYKAFPQPDFDYCGAAARQVALYTRDRKHGKEAETPRTGTYTDLMRYFKHTLIRSYAKRHGVCPGEVKPDANDKKWHRSYPHISADQIPPEHVDDIDMKNTFRYEAHGSDILEMVKDKAICPKDIDTYESSRDLLHANIEDKNQLMDVLSREVPVHMLDLISAPDEIYDDVKADDKPEAKKPYGRWFFEAHTDRRLVQSEYESSVAEYGKTTAGCMAGKGTRDKIAAMNYVCALPTVGSEEFTRPLFISFDLDKFSPSLGMDYHKETDGIFAELFGQPHIAHASDVYTRGKIHYIKRKIHHSFGKMDRDFEGFSGRKNTIYHCAVMGYTVRQLRKLGIIKQSGRFVSLIDDGLLRLEVPVNNYDEATKEILKVIEEIYNMANLYISWDKTFVSSYLAIFLNEFYASGTPITPGLRAFLKITNRSDTLCASMVDDLGMLESTARGAISAGAPANIVYGAYCYGACDAFKKWGKGSVRFSRNLALASFSPISLGGFALVPVGALSGSVSGPAIIEGIGALRSIAVRYRMLAPAINKIVNTAMRPMSAEEKVRSPLAARRMGRTLKVTRGRQVVERKLKNMLNTPVIRSLLGDVSVRDSSDLAHMLTYRARVPVELLAAVHSSSLESALANVSAKFLRARTAMRLVPPKAFFRASIANMTEARALIHEWDN